jgi:polysaccharide export outer membrane protein
MHSKPEPVLRLAAGDQVSVSFLGAPELNTVQTVRRDGKISLRMLGEIRAEGATPKELQDMLLELYKPQLQIKELSVTVQSLSPIFVAGSVNKPGRIDAVRPMTALEAIMEAGGFNERQAELRSVIVIRHEGGRRFGYRLNLQPVMAGEEEPDFYLKPMDIVYVPRMFIAKVNQWIDQYISGILPRLGLGYSSDRGVYYNF